jgi:hypothetical protein
MNDNLHQHRKPWQSYTSFLGVLVCSATLLSSCMVPTDGRPSVMEQFFEAERLFDEHEYKKAEDLLTEALATLDSRPPDELPQLLSNHVNVHNYSIMTLELLAKCKYCNGETKEIGPLTAKEAKLLEGGYTNTFKGTTTNGPQLYLTAFQAVDKVAAGNIAGADAELAKCADLQSLNDRSFYVWLGDKGSPDFGRYLWLNTKAQILDKQGQTDKAKALPAEIESLRSKLAIPAAKSI